MKVMLIGANGAQGKRYQAILEYLGCRALCLDVRNEEQFPAMVLEADAFIVATPTHHHRMALDSIYKKATALSKWEERQIPILCEKPVFHEMSFINSLVNRYNNRVDLCMVNQYQYVMDKLLGDDEHPISLRLETEYDYYHSGGDGLAWDCIQIINLARGEVKLNNKSPIWKCRINGTPIELQDVNEAYVAMVKDFLGDRELVWRNKQIVKAHRKVTDYLSKKPEHAWKVVN